MVARTEADGRPQIDVLPPPGGIGWDPKNYTFEFDADEVRALLSQAIEPSTAPAPPVFLDAMGDTERWVYEQMRDNPPRKRDHEYVEKLFNRRLNRSIKKKTIANYVARYRKQFEKP
jgi:hypothetical protein